MPELSIIIVSYNTKGLLESCLDSLLDHLNKVSYEVILVDNNSSDGTVEMLETRHKSKKENLTLILNQENFGYAKANNQGIRQAKGNFLLLLNPDTKLIDNSLLKMLEFARTTKDFGIGGPRLLNNDGSFQSSVFSDQSILNAIKEFWFGQKDVFMLKVPENKDTPQPVYGVIGAAMLIPKKVVELIGLLNEKYFFYYEDLEYCRRIHKKGYKVYYFSEVRVVHLHGASSSKNREQAQRSMIRGSKMFHGSLKYWILYFILWSGQKLKKVLGT